jgi:hypothetical protein
MLKAALETCRDLNVGRGIFRAGIACVAITTVLHAIALSVAVSYDSHEYIDLADVLFSDRFPADWIPPIRTPGYPFVLHVAFAIFGRHPMGALATGLFFGAGGLLVLGYAVRRIAGPAAAGAALILCSFYPLFISLQHIVLTEIGVFFYLALLVFALTWPAETTSKTTIKAVALILIVTAGYYHRQTFMVLAPLAALLFALEQWRFGFFRAATVAVVVGVSPPLLKIPFAPYVFDGGVLSYTLSYDLIRQMVLPPDDPIVAPAAAEYRKAIAEADPLAAIPHPVAVPIFQVVRSRLELMTLRRFAVIAFHNPVRYAKAVARSAITTVAPPGQYSYGEAAQATILAPGIAEQTNMIAEGVARLDAAIRRDFMQRASTSLIKRTLWRLREPYRVVMIAGIVSLFVVFAVGIATRSLAPFAFASVPLAYAAAHALILSGEDRYVSPIYPIGLAALVIVIALVTRSLSASILGSGRRVGFQKGREPRDGPAPPIPAS